MLPVRCEAHIPKPDGGHVEQKDSIVYLGSVLSAAGTVDSELSRRLGAARAEFEKLARLWSHAALPARLKIRMFEACVLSKLLYSLHTAWLKKLDAFQTRCLHPASAAFVREPCNKRRCPRAGALFEAQFYAVRKVTSLLCQNCARG